jgi:hypothetical protein
VRAPAAAEAVRAPAAAVRAAAVAAAVVAAVAVAAAGGVDMETAKMKTQSSLPNRIVRSIGLTLAAGTLALASGAQAQRAFPTPDAAANAFVQSVATNDTDALKAVVGPNYAEYIPHQTADSVTNFLAAWAKSHKIVRSGDAKAYLEVGANGWTLPIPIVKSDAGWSFDTKATPDELRVRRIGRNELSAIQVMLACGDAEEDYRKFDRDRNGKNDYAQRILSTKGMRDGLYWATKPGEPESPLGSLVASVKPGEGYHGYHYRVLTAQGKDAPGGAKSYIVNGVMTGGYAFVAWPVKWDDTGVMSFMVAKDGTVYEKDLGPDGAAIAKAMKDYNPDSTWSKVPQK